MKESSTYYKYHTVYLTTNLINGKKYLGKHSTNNLNDNYLGSGNLIKKAIEKYGVQNFNKQTLLTFNSLHDAYRAERLLSVIWRVKNSKDFYNLCEGGEGNKGYKIEFTQEWKDNISKGNKGKIPSQKHRDNISKACKGREVWNKGKTGIYSEETLANISSGLKEYYKENPVTEEQKEVIANKLKGRVSPMKDKTHSEETKRKIGTSSKNSKTEDVRLRTSNSMKDVAKNREKVECPHCDKVGAINQMKRWHFDNCKHNPSNIPEILKCPHCGFESISVMNIKRYHFDNCKYKK